MLSRCPAFYPVGVVLGLLLVGAPARAGFTDVTASAGLDYVQSHPGIELAVYAGALAAVDVDADGLTDVVAARSDGSCLLFMNSGDGTFREESQARGLGGIEGLGGIAAGDFTNTGRQDLFMVPLNGHRCFFLVNDGAGHFTERAAERGAALETTVEPHQGFGVSVVDYDRDGFLDIYFTEWGVAGSAEDALHSALLRNRGAAAPGHFENRTSAAGLTQPRKLDTHYGYSAAWADFDEDGWQDLALVADFGGSQLFWNNGDGTFTEQGKASGVALDENGMGVAVGDYDGDGRLDFFVSSIFDRISYGHSGIITGNKLYRNLGGRRFAETAAEAGVDRTGWGWGAAFFDHDNRGAVDLIVTNGITNGLVPEPGVPASMDAENDPTTLFLNDGQGRFTNGTVGSGIDDTGQGRGVVVLDYDNDGDEDVLISNAYGHPILYRNDASSNGNRWLRLRFRGTASNRDGIGAVVRVTSGGRTRTQPFNPSASFLGQREPILHFGLGNAGSSVEAVEIIWPSGVVQRLGALATNASHLVAEEATTQSAPAFTLHPVGGAQPLESALTLTVSASGDPAPVFVWEKDGVAIPGASGPTLHIERLHPADAGAYTARAINPKGSAASSAAIITISANIADRSVAHWWNRALLDAIRADLPAPTIHARNLFHLSAAMWDAFRPYQAEGWGSAQAAFHRENLTPADWAGGREAAQREAISYAAYRVLTERYKNSVGRERSFAGFRWLMERLGYDPDVTSIAGNAPAAVGNRIGAAVLSATRDDGANEAGRYADTSGYVSLNTALNFKLPGAPLQAPNQWQPLAFNVAVTQNGIPLGAITQDFVGANWRMVAGFALQKPTPSTVALDPGPPPLLGSATAAEFRQAAVEVVRYSSQLDPADGAELDISPGVLFNNPLGTNAGTGHPSNPVTGQPYAPNVARRADYGRVLAEYWADGPESETPPGHWNVLLNRISSDVRTSRRIGGIGRTLTPLEWDICAYLALNGAQHDAAIAAWTIKRQYDSARPISMIRYLGGLGQSSDPAQPSYHADGLPLENGLVEVVTAASSAPGQRHAHLAANIGKIAVRSWGGRPSDPATQTGGVGWILAERWMPYQRDTFVTPAFPGYVSGHSTFSRAGAEVLAGLTGTAYFPGGLGEFRFRAGDFLAFEYGPEQDVVLQWATYYDAADQAGLSRLWGGIHIAADDFAGRRLGAEIGRDAVGKMLAMLGGTVETPPTSEPNPIDGLLALPATQVVASGLDVTFSIGTATVDSVKWQVSTDGGTTWSDIANGTNYDGANSRVLEVMGVGEAFDGRRYRFVASAGGRTNTSGAAMLDVIPRFFLMPAGVAVDASGTIFVTDAAGHTVHKIDPQLRITTIAGMRGNAGATDAAGTAARFDEPTAIAVSNDGSVTVADASNESLRRIDGAGRVTTLAGQSGQSGSVDAAGNAARFAVPAGVGRTPDGGFLVADQINNTIRRVTSQGAVSTWAGAAGSPGFADGAGIGARFNQPMGVAVDAQGNGFVADAGNHVIRRISPTGVVSTLAGLAGVAGGGDGVGSAARFNRPGDVAVDAAGNIYVADTGNSAIRKIAPNGLVSTVAGATGLAGLMDGAGTHAWFNQPEAIALDSNGNLIVADTGNAVLRRVTSTGVVTTIALSEAPSPPPTSPPPSPPVTTPVSSGGAGGGGGGGATSYWFFALLTLAAAVRRLLR